MDIDKKIPDYKSEIYLLRELIEEKDAEIERLQTNIDVMKRALRWSEWEEDGDG